jgi:hypothetical protein
VLEEFQRQDRSYRLAILSSHWLQGDTQYKPSAVEDARGMLMAAGGGWVDYSDLADLLARVTTRGAIATDFVLNQLHALIRAPFELLSDYCEDYDEAEPSGHLVQALRTTAWYDYARIIRNTISHNFRFRFSNSDRNRLPITWRGMTLTAALEGTSITYESFWHGSGYQLFLDMRTFAEAMPEVSS